MSFLERLENGTDTNPRAQTMMQHKRKRNWQEALSPGRGRGAPQSTKRTKESPQPRPGGPGGRRTLRNPRTGRSRNQTHGHTHGKSKDKTQNHDSLREGSVCRNGNRHKKEACNRNFGVQDAATGREGVDRGPPRCEDHAKADEPSEVRAGQAIVLLLIEHLQISTTCGATDRGHCPRGW